MAAVRSKNTKPEMFVRRLAHAMGYRFRLHRADLPGTPDLVFPGKRKVIFVHGCFWHQHGCKRAPDIPKSNQSCWGPKLAQNRVRDAEYILKGTECSRMGLPRALGVRINNAYTSRLTDYEVSGKKDRATGHLLGSATHL
jgi:DNA mismatch endonuclease (patch repair protein)